MVVVITPPADGVANVAQSGEPMLGQTRASAAAIESLDAGALHRLVSLDEAQIGASILLPSHDDDVTCHEQFPVHIAGRAFWVSGTPYLQQDNAVGACAQASIWIALRTQMKRVGIQPYVGGVGGHVSQTLDRSSRNERGTPTAVEGSGCAL